MKSLFDNSALEEILNRISLLTSDSSSQWGKMNVAQMCTHCQGPINISLKKIGAAKKPGVFKRVLFSAFKSSLYNDKPWRKGLPTAKSMIIDDERDLNKEKERLISLIKEFHLLKDQEHWDPHPVFGKFTKEQWGKMQYKHLDHHLRQFNV